MSATGREQREAIDNAAMLRMFADIVKHYRLDARGLDNTIRTFRQTAPHELPYIVLRAASVIRGIDMTPAELAAWLRGAAKLQTP
jgi:hypothetical protein